ncbi:MAG: pilus assembly protein [Pseudomonadales bacterium]|nr:pilus assembly protein [Pseudomonadales bacterium]
MRSLKQRIRIKGVAVTETLIVIPVMLMLGMGIVHLGLIYQAKSNLEYAALMAARVGASSSIDITEMRREVKRRMKASDIGSTDLSDLASVQIEVLSPDRTVFDDWGGPPTDPSVSCAGGYGGGCEIPNDNLISRPSNQLGGSSGLNIQDANLLRIRVTYTYDTLVPFMQAFYLDGRNEEDVPSGVELVAYSTVRMQSPARLTDANSCCIN